MRSVAPAPVTDALPGQFRRGEGFVDLAARPSLYLEAVAVPAWAKRAGLAADYRDHVRLYGEEAAALHCRALKRQMGSP